jgi:FkbM family methyltransferase
MTIHVPIFEKTLSFDGHADQYLDHIAIGGEKQFISFAREHIQNGSVVLDVGANIGFISAIFSVANPDGQIYAIEPGPENFEYLTENIRKNSLSNVTPVNIAFSDVVGYQVFHENSAWGYLDGILGQESKFGSTKVTTLDKFVSENKLMRVDLVKIDVEGFEARVFAGMKETIARFNPKIIFEFNTFCMLTQAKDDPIDFMNSISSMFQTICRFNKAHTDPNLLIPVSKENFAVSALHQNIVLDGSVSDYYIYN